MKYHKNKCNNKGNIWHFGNPKLGYLTQPRLSCLTEWESSFILSHSLPLPARSLTFSFTHTTYISRLDKSSLSFYTSFAYLCNGTVFFFFFHFTHSLNNSFLSTHSVPGTVLGTGNRAVNKTKFYSLGLYLIISMLRRNQYKNGYRIKCQLVKEIFTPKW